MRVYYIQHSGFLLETEKSYYLFDYYQGGLPPLAPEKPVTVLCSHAHRDHYNPEVFSLLRSMGKPAALAVLAKDIPEKRYPPQTEILKAYAQRNYDLPCGARLETLRSTDSGVAFVLTTEEGAVYHAGDLNDWTWEGESEQCNRRMRGNYRHEIDLLAGRRFAAAFVPLDPRQEEHYADGLLYFLSRTKPARVYPMHYWQQPEGIGRFLAAHPEFRGVIQNTEDCLGGAEL